MNQQRDEARAAPIRVGESSDARIPAAVVPSCRWQVLRHAVITECHQAGSYGGTGHREAVQIRYDPKQVAYERLLHIFWRSVDPTDGGGQFCDRGESYQTAIFAGNEEERRLAEASKEALEQSAVLDEPVVTPIEPAGEFYPAEDYHQDYYTKNPFRYRFYRLSCGRDSRVQQVWGRQAHEGIERH